MAKKNFTVEDLKRWQQRGLLSDDQLKAILAVEGLEAEPEAPGAKEKKAGLNLVTVAYYFGGLLAFFSLTFFVGMNWEELTDESRLVVALLALLIIGALGVWLRFRQGYPTAGGLLLFVATAILPLFVYTVQQQLGFVFDEVAALYVILIGLAGALAALIFTRFFLISLLVAGFIHAAVLDIAFIGGLGGDWPLILTAAVCGGFILLGITLTRRGRKFYAFWFKLYGLVGLYIAFTSLFVQSEGILLGLLFLLVYLIMVGFSLRFREVIYLIFGAIGVYTYIVRLSFDTFQGTVYFPLLLGGIGISIIVLAVLYQRYGTRLFRRRS
ncbi:MAG: DUF2157 domain-containing protein [Dehalococcoidia bacterium]|nr:MAG: DUF2157 domain-containing protein [Dehalococcoidia bacterium]